MIDTIALKQVTYRLDARTLADLGATPKPGRKNPTWTINPLSGTCSPTITISQTPDAMFHIYAECSIPRLLFGHNARLPETEDDVHKGIDAIVAYVQNRLGTAFDGTTAIVSKIHLTRDYHLGDVANRAVFGLFDKRLRYFTNRNMIAGKSEAVALYFNYASPRRNCVICIYPKHAEVLSKNGPQEALEAAKGNLRIEYRANTRTGVRSLCNRFSVENDSEMLTSDFNNRVFTTLENDLHFPDCVNCQESPMSKLLAVYPPLKAQRLFGFLEIRRLKGDAELTKTDQDRRNFNIARRDCERAGVWLDLRYSEE